MPEATEPVDLQFQRAALVLLLISPSELGDRFIEGDDAEVQRMLRDLGFSNRAITIAMPMLRSFRTAKLSLKAPGDQIDAVSALAKLRKPIIRQHFWDGKEPHPPSILAGAIVRALRALDSAAGDAD
jgi:hypothetical protein